jgi:hypothetical protein
LRWDTGEPIYMLAWEIAGVIRSGHSPSTSQIGALMAAVRGHPAYAHVSPNFDGVPE